jgi:hypothetical protein
MAFLDLIGRAASLRSDGGASDSSHRFRKKRSSAFGSFWGLVQAVSFRLPFGPTAARTSGFSYRIWPRAIKMRRSSRHADATSASARPTTPPIPPRFTIAENIDFRAGVGGVMIP